MATLRHRTRSIYFDATVATDHPLAHRLGGSLLEGGASCFDDALCGYGCIHSERNPHGRSSGVSVEGVTIRPQSHRGGFSFVFSSDIIELLQFGFVCLKTTLCAADFCCPAIVLMLTWRLSAYRDMEALTLGAH